MTDRELMKEALETFEKYACANQWVNARSLVLMYALRDRLEQPDREWVGLTDEEIIWIENNTNSRFYNTHARAIEAKLKEKNT